MYRDIEKGYRSGYILPAWVAGGASHGTTGSQEPESGQVSGRDLTAPQMLLPV